MSQYTVPSHRTTKRRSISLVASFMIGTWLVSVAMIALIAGFLLWRIPKMAEDQVRATASGMAVAVAASVGDTRSQPASALDASLHHITERPFVAFVRVRQANGGLIASAGDPGIPANQVWVESVPVLYFSERIGTVEVGMLRTAAEEFLRMRWLVTLLATVIGSVLSAGAAYVVARATARPIKAVQRLAIHWESPNFEQTGAVGGPTEVQQLYRSVQEMRGHALARKADLEAQVKARTDELAAAYSALDESFQQTAVALAHALEFRDYGTADHTSRTAVLATRIGNRIGLPHERQRILTLAATLHDIGKIGVPEGVLTKAGPLTAEERQVMKTHPVIAETILRDVPGMAEVARIVRHHHERWDGNGYPDGLSGPKIPLESRIIALADTVEAMSSDRYYRRAIPPEMVAAEVRRCTGSQFDPEVVAAGWPEVCDILAEWSKAKAGASREAGAQ